MGNALISSEQSSSFREKQQRKFFLSQSKTTTVQKQKQHTVQKSCSTIHQDQFNQIDSNNEDDFYFDNEDEETKLSFERRTATLRDTKIATAAFLAACTDLKKSVSIKVDDLLNDLPDAHYPQFEAKYKTVRQQLQKFFQKNWNKSKQKNMKKRYLY